MKTEAVQVMRKEYTNAELGQGIRGKYYESYRSGRNIVRLTPEVAQVFPDEDSVNEALMELIRIARVKVSTTKSSSGENR